MAKSEVRIDKWLWAMRLYKTRTISADACKKGRVSVGDGIPAKPSRMIRVGETIHVRKPPITYTFRVKALTENRLGAKLVPDYLEDMTPRSQYDLLEAARSGGFVGRAKGLGRPTKREGRDLARFTGESFDSDWEDDLDFEDEQG